MTDQPTVTVADECPDCNGTGLVYERTALADYNEYECDRCGGTGEVEFQLPLDEAQECGYEVLDR